jgi:hypothetical protein
MSSPGGGHVRGEQVAVGDREVVAELNKVANLTWWSLAILIAIVVIALIVAF